MCHDVSATIIRNRSHSVRQWKVSTERTRGIDKSADLKRHPFVGPGSPMGRCSTGPLWQRDWRHIISPVPREETSIPSDIRPSGWRGLLCRCAGRFSTQECQAHLLRKPSGRHPWKDLSDANIFKWFSVVNLPFHVPLNDIMHRCLFPANHFAYYDFLK